MKFPKLKLSKRAQLLLIGLLFQLLLIARENNSRFGQAKTINAYLLVFAFLFFAFIYTVIETRKEERKNELFGSTNLKSAGNTKRSTKSKFIETNPNKIKEKPYIKTLFLDDTKPIVSSKEYKRESQPDRTPMINVLNQETRHSLIDDLIKNSIDEIMLVRIYEEFFNCDIQIMHGHINAYVCEFTTHTTTLDYPTLKDDLMRALRTDHPAAA